MIFNEKDRLIMQELIALAATMKGKTTPNPVVAAAVVKNQQIIATGVHQKYGTPHAEPLALAKAGKQAVGADLFVTLEPCTHYGKTPPCTEAIIKHKIKRVIYAVTDPNPMVRMNGGAKAVLEAQGIAVCEGLMQEEAWLINEVYFKNTLFHKPFVTMKAAASLDGKIALHSGESKYITGPFARKRVHEIRNQNDAIVVGVGTISLDNPALSIRHGIDPNITKFNNIRVVIDSKLSVLEEAKIFKDPVLKVFIATNEVNKKKQPEKIKNLEQKATLLFFKNTKNTSFWSELLTKLYENKVFSLLIEGGGKVFASAIEAGIVDKVIIHYAPKFLLEEKATSMTRGRELDKLSNAPELKKLTFHTFEDSNFEISGYFNYPLDWLWKEPTNVL